MLWAVEVEFSKVLAEGIQEGGNKERKKKLKENGFGKGLCQQNWQKEEK
jgi:hypothetical protein